MTQAPSPPPAEPGGNLPELSVGELSQALKRTVESAFGRVRVRGEISQAKYHGSGHLYLTLKDERAVLAAVCWRGTVRTLAVRAEDGLEVVCTGRLTTYDQQSKYQLVIEAMEPAGRGAILMMLEERRRRLAAEGLFDAERKRPLPGLPAVVGIVTSPTGAVIRDILHRLADRFPRRVLLWPVAVQGEAAAAQIAEAIAGFGRLDPAGPLPRPDVLIVARGGGSVEDLMAFNDEAVVRAVAASPIPVISAIGHETDTTLIDFAADHRAPTPTAAAERAVPVRSDLLAGLLDRQRRLVDAMARRLTDARTLLAAHERGLGDPMRLLETALQRLDDRADRLALAVATDRERKRARLGEIAARLVHPRERLAGAGRVLDQLADRLTASGEPLTVRRRDRAAPWLGDRLDRAARARFGAAEERLGRLDGLLESYSYRNVLARGYAVVRDADDRPVVDPARLTPAMPVAIEFHGNRRVPATIDGVGTGGAGAPRPPRRRGPDGRQGRLF